MGAPSNTLSRCVVTAIAPGAGRGGTASPVSLRAAASPTSAPSATWRTGHTERSRSQLLLKKAGTENRVRLVSWTFGAAPAWPSGCGCSRLVLTDPFLICSVSFSRLAVPACPVFQVLVYGRTMRNRNSSILAVNRPLPFYIVSKRVFCTPHSVKKCLTHAI